LKNGLPPLEKQKLATMNTRIGKANAVLRELYHHNESFKKPKAFSF